MYENSGIFPVDYYPSLNGPFLKKAFPLNVYVCYTVCFVAGMPLKSVRLHSKSHQKSSKCLEFPLGLAQPFLGRPIENKDRVGV